MFAAKNEHLDALDMLVLLNADSINEEDKNCMTILMHVLLAKDFNAKLAKRLIKRGGDHARRMSTVSMRPTGDATVLTTLVHVAAQQGHKGVIMELVSAFQNPKSEILEVRETDGANKASPSAASPHPPPLGRPELRHEGQHLEAIEATWGGRTPLFVACQHGHVDVVEYLHTA